MKKKVAIASIIATTMLLGTNVYAEDALQYGQEVEVQTDSGSYKITIDKVVENNQLNDDDKTVKVVCVDCLIENVDYKNYDNQLGSYDVGKGAVALLDADGISAEFYNLSASSDDGYELYTTIQPGEKKRVALPYFVPENTDSVTVKIDSKYEISQNLDEESSVTSEKSAKENTSSEESQSDDKYDELLQKIEELEAKNAELEDKLNKTEEEKNQEEAEPTATPEPTEAPAEETPTPEPTEAPETEPAQEEAAAEEAAPEEEPKPVVEYKDATTIRIVQQALNDAGYNCGNPDGVAGGKTTEAVTKYQTDKGLTVNGLITDELLQALNVVEKVQDAVQKEASKAEYSSDYTYDQLARNPDTYKGQKMKFTGKVLEAGNDDDICYARIELNSNIDTILFVTYKSDLLGYRLLDDDNITVYGTSLGVYSYKSVGAGTITIPWLNADMIEM